MSSVHCRAQGIIADRRQVMLAQVEQIGTTSYAAD